MSHMSNKDIEEFIAAHKDCEVTYVCDQCEKEYTTGLNGRFCSEACFEAYDAKQDDYKVEQLIHEKEAEPRKEIKPPVYYQDLPRYLKQLKEEQDEIELIRNGETAWLRTQTSPKSSAR